MNKISLFSYHFLLSIINIWVALAQYSIPPPLIARLNYYQSENSPYYNPTTSTKDLADIDLMSSISRASYLTAQNRTNLLLQLTDLETPLFAGKQNGFLARLKVGSSNVEQLLYMDTGSNLLWINCEPCGYNVPGPIFDLLSSSSYHIEDCKSSDRICDNSGAVDINCANVDNCSYVVQYGGERFSAGHLARETFTFGMSSQTTLENIIFGCAKRTNVYANGVLGLGNLRLSLLSQYNATKFSYCIGSISNRTYAYNTLVIGSSIELWGSQTPLIVESKNFINLESIKIGDYSLEFDQQIFVRNSSEYTGGMMVDTGSSFSFIPRVVLDDFENIINNLIVYELDLGLDSEYNIKYKDYNRLCYHGEVSTDLIGFPWVKLQFQDNAVMELTVENIFQKTEDNIFCLAILPSEILGTTSSILGSLMQQNFYVGYDLLEKKLSFQRMVCKAVDEYYHDDEL